ncbi:MAG: hypothetical protein ACXVO9_13590 [Bacteroidia bacterium]
MSSHFNYEIDERNLREKLKGMETPFKEDAWAQFEGFSNIHRSAHKSSALPAIHLNINRTLILPFVFGGVIILFSLLLFNFISINNKNLTEVVKTSVIPKKQPEPEKEAVAAPVIKEEIIDTVKVKAPAIETPLINTVVITPTIQNVNVEAKVIPVATIAATPAKIEGSWTSLSEGRIYSSPNIASEVIGNSAKNRDYTAIEETNYFIKVAFTKDNKTEFGFIRKDALRKNGHAQTPYQSSSVSNRQKNRKAENLESIKTPVSLSAENTNEPELK